jgi:hypothetical protein
MVKALRATNPNGPFQVLVLRLSGEVDLVEWDGLSGLDIVLEK